MSLYSYNFVFSLKFWNETAVYNNTLRNMMNFPFPPNRKENCHNTHIPALAYTRTSYSYHFSFFANFWDEMEVYNNTPRNIINFPSKYIYISDGSNNRNHNRNRG